MIITKRYNRENAVTYARRWALSRNPLFYDFTGGGGDCTNFVSQCLLAGSCTMDYTDTFGWYYLSADDRAPAWSSVEFLYDYLTGSGDFPPNDARSGPFGREVRMRQVQPGDVVQLARGGDFYHTLIISEVERTDLLVCAHSNDALDRRLSTYTFDSLRLIHIDGVRVSVDEEDCFTALLEGISLP